MYRLLLPVAAHPLVVNLGKVGYPYGGAHPKIISEAEMAIDTQAAKPSKAHAVFLALQELGKDAKRGPIQAFVKERFGIEMEIGHVSTARAEARKKMASSTRKPAAKQAAPVMPAAAQERPAVAKPQPSGNGTTITLADIVSLKALVKRVGAENLKKLIDVIG